MQDKWNHLTSYLKCWKEHQQHCKEPHSQQHDFIQLHLKHTFRAQEEMRSILWWWLMQSHSNLSAGDHNSTKRYPPSTVLVWCFQICPKDLFVWGTQTSFSGKNQPLFPAVQATISLSSTEVAGVLLTSVTSGDAKWQEPRRTLQELSKTLAAIPCWHLCLTVSFCPQHHMQKLFYSSVH